MTIIYKVTVTEKSGNDLTNYAVKITIDSSLTDFWKYANTGNIYFLDDSGNPLYFWIEEFDTTNKKATIWVKIPGIEANKSKIIYMYIDDNNPYKDYNDPSKVFEIYDDFTESSLRSDWSIVKGTPKLENGYLVLPNDTSIKHSQPYGNVYVKIKCHIDTLPTNNDGGLDIIFVKDSSGKYYDAWINYKSGTTQNNADLRYYPGQTPYKWYNGDWTPDTKSHIWEIYRDQNGNMKLLLDGSQKVTAQDTNVKQGTDMTILAFGSDTFNMYIDYVLVRPYVDPEPSVSVEFYKAYGSTTITILTYDTRTITITTYSETTTTSRSISGWIILLILLLLLLAILLLGGERK